VFPRHPSTEQFTPMTSDPGVLWTAELLRYERLRDSKEVLGCSKAMIPLLMGETVTDPVYSSQPH
jgi:hypothetical protein